MFSCYATNEGDSGDEANEPTEKNMAGIPLGVKVNYYFQSELEYLYNGDLTDARDNLKAVTGMIYLVRFVMNYTASFVVPSVNKTVADVEAAVAFGAGCRGHRRAGAAGHGPGRVRQRRQPTEGRLHRGRDNENGRELAFQPGGQLRPDCRRRGGRACPTEPSPRRTHDDDRLPWATRTICGCFCCSEAGAPWPSGRPSSSS